jgi:hypothetical protein
MEVITNFIWKKYANPWSIWVRFFILPMLIISMWSRIWIEQWSLLLVLITLAWIYFNPRISPNKKTKNIWAIQAVLGERLWLNRHKYLIPEHHFFVITALQIIVIIGFVTCLVGILFLNVWLTFFGLSVTYICMCWFLDRMVWLYNDDKRLREENRIKLIRQQRKKQRQRLIQKMSA